MSAELVQLERKIDATAQRLSAKFDLVLAKLDEMNRTGQPGLTQAKFARLIGRTPRTISRWVKARKLRLEKGLVPNSEIRKHLS